MLIYHPIHDVNHCVYRLLLILETTQHSTIDIDLYRIVDFYTIFPSLLKNIKPFPAELSAFKRVLKEIPDPYERLTNVKRTMHELEPIQTTAIQNLLAKNIIDLEAFRARKLERTDTKLPQEIAVGLRESVLVNEEWFRMLINEFPTISFTGRKGLKARTGLMEFRYDVEPV
ncbi:ABC-three component system middle component 5 [Teredinibacter turnerae]|uniref:ABC-three component system middle component 5 n=1 Tax=Teredinibacter turnerae TaxID=2426 RepID=UPI00048BCED1|nr:ABC-three component system middle component 5 [Teredinibacter turnerae]